MPRKPMSKHTPTPEAEAQIAQIQKQIETMPVGVTSTQALPPRPVTTTTIFTFFDYCEQMDYATELSLLMVWLNLWRDAGYKPVILNEWHARQNPRYDAFVAKVLTFPSVNGVGPQRYETRCFQRHAAAEMIGGVFVDHDVVPNTARADTHPILVSDTLTTGELGCPSMIVGTPKAFAGFVDFILALPDGKVYDHVNGTPHCSDMYCGRDMHLPHNGLVKQFTEDGWESAPFVHFSHHATREHRPRHLQIPMLLKLNPQSPIPNPKST